MEHDDDRPARRRPAVNVPHIRAGRFADTATDETDDLRVVSRDFDERKPFAVKWAPRVDAGGPVYPTAGDLAFIAEVRGDDYTGWIVVMWEPA